MVPPKLSVLCNGCHSGRADDNAESLKKRFATFESATRCADLCERASLRVAEWVLMRCVRPVLNYFASKGAVHKVDTSAPVDSVFAQVETLLSRILPQVNELQRRSTEFCLPQTPAHTISSNLRSAKAA